METNGKDKSNLDINKQGTDSETKLLESLNQLIKDNPESGEHYIARAEHFFRKNELGKAVNDYEKALSLLPENHEIKVRLDMIKTILRYNNTDIYASPNTDMDPWLE